MPTVLRFDGYSVVIYPADHIPAHVHVFGGGNEAMFNLNCPAGLVMLRENTAFPVGPSPGFATRSMKPS